MDRDEDIPGLEPLEDIGNTNCCLLYEVGLSITDHHYVMILSANSLQIYSGVSCNIEVKLAQLTLA